MALDCGPILIVDNDALFRSFVSGLLERAGFVTALSSSGEEAVTAARAARPGLVLLDVDLPDMSGFEVCRELRDEFGDDLPIMFVSADRTAPFDRAAGLLVGGDDYLPKPVDPDEFLARARRLIARSRRGRVSSPLAPREATLTAREREVLALLAEGLHPKEIARDLLISPKTVASHMQHVLAKLGARSRAEAVAIAYKEGFMGDRVPVGAEASQPEGEVPAETG